MVATPSSPRLVSLRLSAFSPCTARIASKKQVRLSFFLAWLEHHSRCREAQHKARHRHAAPGAAALQAQAQQWQKAQQGVQQHAQHAQHACWRRSAAAKSLAISDVIGLSLMSSRTRLLPAQQRSIMHVFVRVV